ncbi:unnamed protein product [Brassicogethes aeneus]|uniref:Uncharacterized protein n=1 Tax=Brassicogethes aeneus TaxID=1431903 RepID=A0A9P0FNI0_BRAAE|nr:unnamed protein product [Brassicogethes aeneus]
MKMMMKTIHVKKNKEVNPYYDFEDDEDNTCTGRLISLALIHGGPGPHFFTESLFSLLTSGPADNVPYVDDLEEDIKKEVLKLNEIEHINVLQDYLTEEPIFAIAGRHFKKRMEEKQTVFRDIVQFYGFHRVRPALKQLKNGLETGNVLNLIKKYHC